MLPPCCELSWSVASQCMYRTYARKGTGTARASSPAHFHRQWQHWRMDALSLSPTLSRYRLRNIPHVILEREIRPEDCKLCYGTSTKPLLGSPLRRVRLGREKDDFSHRPGFRPSITQPQQLPRQQGWCGHLPEAMRRSVCAASRSRSPIK